MKLGGKVAIVTGASCGIGAGIALELARDGAHVMVNYNSTREGAERVDAFTIRYTGGSFWSIFHHHFYGKPDFPYPE